ncbi:NAD(P)H-dependent oxidoreductase [Crocinitomix sp.]|nr:NAD(P)H-dependent oxidoreductase [Crocinitomix sp.]
MDKVLINALNNRYATKKFNPDKKVLPKDLDAILEAIRLTPTSYGLQLMKVVVVENKALRELLLGESFGQNQIVEASHVLVLCREKNVDENHIQAYISNIAITREIPTENLEGFKNMMVNSILGMSQTDQIEWMDKQVYIALGNLLTACALLGIDSCPMEGFKVDGYDKILELGKMNLTANLVIPIGYRSDTDKNAKIKKVRRSKDDFIIRL